MEEVIIQKNLLLDDGSKELPLSNHSFPAKMGSVWNVGWQESPKWHLCPANATIIMACSFLIFLERSWSLSTKNKWLERNERICCHRTGAGANVLDKYSCIHSVGATKKGNNAKTWNVVTISGGWRQQDRRQQCWETHQKMQIILWKKRPHPSRPSVPTLGQQPARSHVFRSPLGGWYTPFPPS